MKIAQLAPLHESVPPQLYGGTERVVSYLTEELVRQGHDVTLYASGDSATSAHLRALCPEGLRLRICEDPTIWHVYMLEKLRQEAHLYDIVHSHIDYLAYPVFRTMQVPNVTTLHGRLDLDGLHELYSEFTDIPVVSISEKQRSFIPSARWAGTVYHGLPPDLLNLRDGGGGYLAFLGRISPEKGIPLAIEIAKRSNLPLKIAAKVSAFDQKYFEQEIRPLLDHPLIEYIGEIGELEKEEFLGNALGLLFTIDWPEPFGLVMIEALACGTPVIACRCGSVPEIIDHGRTGYIIKGLDEGLAAVKRLDKIDRRECRSVFDRRFTAQRMAEDYVKLYRRLHFQRHGIRLATPGVVNA